MFLALCDRLDEFFEITHPASYSTWQFTLVTLALGSGEQREGTLSEKERPRRNVFPRHWVVQLAAQEMFVQPSLGQG